MIRLSIYAGIANITVAETVIMKARTYGTLCAGRRKKVNEQMKAQRRKASDWLNRAFYTEEKIKALEKVREKNRALAVRCSSSAESGNSSGSKENSQERILFEICENDREIREEIQILIDQRNEIKKAIDSVRSTEYQAILAMRYLAYKKTHEIAAEYNYDRRTIQRKHNAALEMLIENMSLNVAPEQ